MTTRTVQKDLLSDLKKEICLNIGLLNKLQPVSAELSTIIFKDNVMEKPTQFLFIHLTYYLVSIIDSHASESLPWPLYDTKTERLYRNGLFMFISDYSSKGLLSPIMSSYLVNAGCYKVIMLVHQMSILAIQKFFLKKISTEQQRELYDKMTEKYKSNESVGFLEEIHKETNRILLKFSKYFHKRKIMEHIAQVLCTKIVKMEHTLTKCNVENYIDELIDKFIEKYHLDDNSKEDLLKLTNVNERSTILESWLMVIDEQLNEIETKWDNNMEPFIKICQKTQNCTQELINRHIGEMDKSLYMIEYNPKTDEIQTQELEKEVNIEQKFILKNIVKDEKLIFPYLVRGFLVAICHILRNAEIEDNIQKFNECLENARSHYTELTFEIKTLLDRVVNSEAKLEPSPAQFVKHLKEKPNLFIPPIPLLSDLRSNRHINNQNIFDPFTPVNTLKHQFNLVRKKNLSMLRTQSTLTTPFYGLKDDFSKSILATRGSYNHNISQNFHNISIIAQPNRVNETICESGTGFSKQQIQRLLSTKKSSSSKKFKSSSVRPDINIKKGGLFKESNVQDIQNSLFRSYSSPDLFENRSKALSKLEKRKLSIMQEDLFPSLLEVSGIAALDTDSYETSQSPKLTDVDAKSNPLIIITEPQKQIGFAHKDNKEAHLGNHLIREDEKTETPKNNVPLMAKTNSLEKIINRFRKVRANVFPTDKTEDNEFKTIFEEKENNNRENEIVPRILLPDLLSPSCSISQESIDYFDQNYDNDDKVRRKPKESLGSALGVDHTFLDQFDLID